jgi:hypothetical protein
MKNNDPSSCDSLPSSEGSRDIALLLPLVLLGEILYSSSVAVDINLLVLKKVCVGLIFPNLPFPQQKVVFALFFLSYLHFVYICSWNPCVSRVTEFAGSSLNSCSFSDIKTIEMEKNKSCCSYGRASPLILSSVSAGSSGSGVCWIRE